MKKNSIKKLSPLFFLLALLALPAPSGAAEVTIGTGGEVLVDGAPFYPIMTWLQSSFRIETEKDLGINTFVGNGGGGPSSDYLDVCQGSGVWCVMDPGDMSVMDHPSLLGWIFGDEPDLESNQVEPSEIQAEYDGIKAADPHHITFLTLTAGFYSEMNIPTWMGGSRDRYPQYCAATDVVGFDIYPIYGWCRPDRIYWTGDSQEELRSIYAGSTPTYQWIEAVRTSSQWCELSERGDDDGPYDYEIRNEVWQAIVHGAKAVGYFTHSWECPDYTQICLSTQQEDELRRTNRQITELTGPILAADAASAVEKNALDGGRVDVTARQVGSNLTIFAVSLERTAQRVSFTVSDMPADSAVEVYDESRTITAAGTSFEDSFDELGVHIYVAPLPGGVEEEGLPEPADEAAPELPADAGPDSPPDAVTDAAADHAGPDAAADAGEEGGEEGGCGCRIM
jgi:hypothetical protein